MSKSIMQDDKECYITGSTEGLHKHHIYRGSHRKAAEEYGCWVWLRADWHNMSGYGVHNDSELDLRLKRDCQIEFEQRWGHERFIETFGRNYI